MIIANEDAYSIEKIVCKVFQCRRGWLGGLVDTNHFERKPFDATIICISKLHNEHHEDFIKDFVAKWSTIFDYPEENQNYTSEMYVEELNELVNILSN